MYKSNKTTKAMIALLVLIATSFVSADVIYLRDGEQAPGKLTKMDKKKVVFETADGLQTYKKSDVLKLQLQRARQYDDIEKVDQITDPDLLECLSNLPDRNAYPSAGYVTLLRRKTVDTTTPGIVKETVRHIALVLQQRGEDVATKNILYFEDTDTPKINFALTVTPDGRVLHLDDAALKNENI